MSTILKNVKSKLLNIFAFIVFIAIFAMNKNILK